MGRTGLSPELELVEVYHHYDPENPFVWNQLADACLAAGELSEAARFNERALAIKEFPAGLETKARIREQLPTTDSLRDRLFGT